MRGLRLFGFVGLLAGMLALRADPAWGQANNANGGANGGANNTNNTNNVNNNNTNTGSLANAPAGVIISTEGLLRVRSLTEKTGELTKTRIAESRARLGANLAK